jgi:hypothetical protein
MPREPSRGARDSGANQTVERVPDVGEGDREEVTVDVQRDVDRRVSELRSGSFGCAPAATISAA